MAKAVARGKAAKAKGPRRPAARPSARPAARPARKAKAPAKAAAKRPKPAPRPAAKATPAKTAEGKDADADLSVAGQVYRNGKLTEGILHVDTRTGRIVRLAKSTRLATHLDFGGMAILPGAIDIHVHFREPGHTHKEDITTGSVAAAFGGVTGFVDMPNTLPATTTLRTLKEKLALMAARSVVDYAAWAGGSWYVGDLPQMLRSAAGVKTYLGATTGDLLLDDAERFQQVLAACGTAGKTAVLHAESQRILAQMRRQEGTAADHDMFRPPLAEVEAIYDAMKALSASKKPPRVHVAHAASPEAVQAATTAKFSIGVTPHHLLLDTASPLTHAYGKVNPPLRSPAVRKALLDLFAAGRIPILESDHAPHTTVEKEDNFHAAPAGMPGVETMLPVMLAQVKAGKLDLGRVVDAATANPAALLGVADRGALEPGMRADFAVYDLKHTVKVDGGKLHSRCGWSPFDGHPAIFPSHTYLAGKPVVQDGDLVGAPGSGKSILPLPKE
jgi:dihydroorotase